MNWYAHRYIRACAAWEVEDITPELLNVIDASPKRHVPRTLEWYIALINMFPNRVKYTINDVYTNDSGGVFGKSGYKKPPDLSIESFPQTIIELNPNIKSWVTTADTFVKQLYDDGTKSYYTYYLAIGKLIKKFIAQDEPVPLIRNVTRDKHIGLIKDALKKGVGKVHYREQLRKVHEFFEYVSRIEQGFPNPISRKSDFPIVKRSKSTNKEILDEKVFSAFLSYLYSIADWIWFISETYEDKLKYINEVHNDFNGLKAAATGFQPMVFVDGNYRVIDKIPRQLLTPLFNHNTENTQLTQTAIMPHFIHLAIVMAETGIRQLHLRWLDKNLYDEKVDRIGFQERSYIPSKLYVNTDKSHGSWHADVSEAVIGILDRQKVWRSKYLKGIDKPIPYDHFENSEFEDITPLFSTANNVGTTSDNFSIVTDSTFRQHFKNLLIGFSWFYKSIGKQPPLEINDCNSLEECLKKWRKANIPFTPHAMRAQIVSDNITILPPSIIQRVTGHSNEAHVLYYAKLNEGWINKQQKSQDKEFMDFISPIFIDTKTESSTLNRAIKLNPLGALKEFGTVSFGTREKSGLNKITDDIRINKDVHEAIAFNSTHMCPFANKCPPDIENSELKEFKNCGSCPYALKTVDHLPAIVAKIRAFTDKATELEEIISTVKKSGSDLSMYQGEISLKKYYANEISAWTVTASCLEKMAQSMEFKDNWLVAKPEFLKKELKSLKSSSELMNILVRVEEALSSEEFLTPQLKAKVAIFRNKMLVQSGQFQKVLSEIPTGKKLISEFKGIIKGICDITGINIKELPKALEEQRAFIPNFLDHNVSLPNGIKREKNE